MGLFAKSQSGRRRTKRFDLESAAKGDTRGLASVFRPERLFDVVVAAVVVALELGIVAIGIERLDVASLAGVAVILLAANIVVGQYLSLHHKPLLDDRRSLLRFHAVTLAALGLAKLFIALPSWPDLLFPFAIFAVTVSVAYGERLAAFWTLVVAAVIGLMSGVRLYDAVDPTSGLRLARKISIDFPLAATLATGALVAVFALPRVTRRRKVIQAGLFAGIAFSIMIVATRLLLLGREDFLAEITSRPRQIGLDVAFGFLNGLFTGYFMVEIGLRFIEETFDVVTDLRLQELADLNQPILKKFAIEAPGTFHHSQMVGTLAEAAAEAIGANPLLCRVGAHFHDIGKMAKPEYYIENVTGGVTKHDGLTPTMSTLIIHSHVKDGIELAEELGLPPRVIDCIPEHHGTIVVEYFYHQALKVAQEQGGVEAAQISKDDFRYPGPKPQSKETAILMIADSVEAISRVLTEPNPSRIEAMVHDVVVRRLTEGQFDECGITLRELKEVERAMCRLLMGIFHGRIKYPKGPVLPAAKQPGDRSAADDTQGRIRLAGQLADGPGTPSAAAGSGAGAASPSASPSACDGAGGNGGRPGDEPVSATVGERSPLS